MISGRDTARPYLCEVVARGRMSGRKIIAQTIVGQKSSGGFISTRT
jgi:hypothetical protein